VAGVKLEDQQWEDEHGLGLSDEGVDHIELIKGPASLMFGSGAMGGVVNVVEESLPEPGTTKQNLNFKLFSNTDGAFATTTIQNFTIPPDENTYYDKDVNFAVRNQSGTEKYYFTIVDVDGNIIQKSLTFTVE
jgi:hypothetical protein